jgi:hypothetical protein
MLSKICASTQTQLAALHSFCSVLRYNRYMQGGLRARRPTIYGPGLFRPRRGHRHPPRPALVSTGLCPSKSGVCPFCTKSRRVVGCHHATRGGSPVSRPQLRAGAPPETHIYPGPRFSGRSGAVSGPSQASGGVRVGPGLTARTPYAASSATRGALCPSPARRRPGPA